MLENSLQVSGRFTLLERATSSALKAELACRSFEMAVFCRGKPSNLVYHSDRDVQYASSQFRLVQKQAGIIPSISRKGNCYDNAVAESFFDILKVELVHRYKFATKRGARMLLANFTEEFYNHNRTHSTLGFFSPAEYETLMTSHSNNRVH